MLHASLYAKKHDTLNACIKDAIDFDDNCKNFGNVNTSVRLETSRTKNTIETGKNHPIEAEVIAEMVMKKINQVFRPSQRPAEQPRFVKQYIVGNVEEIILLHNDCQSKIILTLQLHAWINGVILNKSGQIMKLESAIIAYAI